MNFNIIAYTIYLPTMIFITVGLGYTFFKNGRSFILKQFNNDEELTDYINKALLVAYYLINLGYCFWVVSQWNNVNNWAELLTSLSDTIGAIALGLGIMHFINISVLLFMGRKKRIEENRNQLDIKI